MRRWKPSLPQNFTSALLAAIRAASKASDEIFIGLDGGGERGGQSRAGGKKRRKKQTHLFTLIAGKVHDAGEILHVRPLVTNIVDTDLRLCKAKGWGGS